MSAPQTLMRLTINAEALLKYSLPQRTNNGWNRPKLSARQFNVLQKSIMRSNDAVWPLPEPEIRAKPERQSQMTILQRSAPLREKRVKDAMAGMPKLIADKMKAAREKKKKETENSVTALVPNYVKGGPYPHNYRGEITKLKMQAAAEKEKKKVDFIAQASKKTKSKK
ncbi:hypothetical protein SAMD00019534_037930, partial [Acytostelium subglobosum LB1]|uniref:hypothetical protein n=1 Tax=Acytostelium subglobosum LB1 TaxID=1410327 RepID=UPI0006449B0E